jgi:copper chaperone CopZ
MVFQRLDPGAKIVTVNYQPDAVTPDAIKDAIKAQGYDVTG